ncbi:MAG: ABC transporter ATP-binding protein [Actinomycetota bacterium]|nr:ABC transporter ATP-binding protein [Actinomycetota bacterium]
MREKESGTPALEALNLTKRFGSVTAVDGISFSVEEGEIFGFLGPNGAGKTTTIRLFLNLTRPSSGEARVFGLDSVRNSIEVKSIVGIVPDVSNVFSEISTTANILFTASLYGIGRKERMSRMQDLLETMGLSEYSEKKAGQLSYGLKRRLAIAMSIVHSPRVVFLDEPTSGLDVSSSREIRELLRNLKYHGTTFFLTTHNMEEANELCNRIAVIDRGRIIAVDTPERLRREATEAQVIQVEFNRVLDENEQRQLVSLGPFHKIVPMKDSYKLFTGDPEEAIECVFHFAFSNDLRICGLNTLKPTLEDVFVKLTDREASFGSHA